MIAQTRPTHSIAKSVDYGQNPEKGGEIVYGQYVDQSASPSEMAWDFIAMSRNYRPPMYNVVLSLSVNDSEIVRAMDRHVARSYVQDLIKAFIAEMAERGNDIDHCPMVVAEHDNKPCLHFHMSVLTTTIEGKRLRDKFIKKNAMHAAAIVSLKYGLEGAPTMMNIERALQTKRGRSTDGFNPDRIHHARLREEARRQAIERKQWLTATIARAGSRLSGQELKDFLKSEGIFLSQDRLKGWIATTIGSDGRKHVYALEKQLGIDLNDKLSLPVKTTPRASVASATISAFGSCLSTPTVSGSGQNREWEVGKKKKRRGDDDDYYGYSM